MISETVITPGEAFSKALKRVWEDGTWVGDKKEIRDAVIEITEPDQRSIYHDDIVHLLDKFHGEDHFQIVSEYTFPEKVSTGLTDEPRPTDESGEYFERLCQCEKGNQLQSLVDKVDQWGRNNRTLAQVFQVDRDLNAMFPPCLLDIQVLYRDGDINLSATYRSHTVAKSYYGDIVSLTNLQSWLCDELEAGIGTIVVHSRSLHVRKDNGEHELAEKMYRDIAN